MTNNNFPIGSYRIFISYAREDARETAVRLRDDLAAAGHDAWLDLTEIAVGASWSRDIEEAIEDSDILLALLSIGSYISDICRAEQLRALRKGKRVIPLLIQSDADRPIHLENLNYIDFCDEARYDDLLGDLLTYIDTGDLPTHSGPNATTASPFKPAKQNASAVRDMQQKRDVRAFRRYIADLREEPWLAENQWWTHFLFYYDDVERIARILEKGSIRPPYDRNRRQKRWEHCVKLNFRPRTPDLFGAEGIRPKSKRMAKHSGVPVYLLFDLAAIITLPLARFSDGDVFQTMKTFKAAAAFRDLPFDLIYHDGPFPKDQRDEIISARKAQVILPESKSLKLDHLRYIWCRSVAEYETLSHLLPENVWREWGDRITARTDYELFNRNWAYVDTATLSAEGALFTFHVGQEAPKDIAFAVSAEIISANEERCVIDLENASPRDDLALDFTGKNIVAPYTIRLSLDNSLAYAGKFTPKSE